jgi:hypothetical protein
LEGRSAANDSFEVWNSGGATLIYTVSEGATWISSVTPTGGSSTGGHTSHTVTYNTAGLTAGTYGTDVTVSAAGATNTPLLVHVSLTVQPNEPPTVPASPLPADGAGGQALNVDLGWSASTDPDGDAVTYDVYFGKDVLPGSPVSSGQAATSYDPGRLAPLSQYQWQVVAKDGHGGVTPGPQWSFSTRENAPPAVPSGPVPADGAGDQALSVDLGWSASIDPDGHPVTYDVYFGKDALPGTPVSVGQSALAYDPGLLARHSTYHWRVVAKDDLGATSTGPEWSFTTLNRAPTAPTNPSPAHQSSDQHVDVALAWSAATDPDGDTVTYDLYLGIGSLPGTPTASNLGSPAYNPGILSASSSYRWQVVARDAYGGATAGSQWSFTTGAGEESSPPGIHITYPTAADSPLATSLITVEGTANDTSTIEAIWVNGVRATDTGTNYSSWEATIPLSEGWTDQDPNAANVVVASALDEWGNYDPSADSVTVESIGASGKVRSVGANTQYRGALVAGDVDSFQFESLTGALLSLAVRRYGRAEVGFAVELRDPWGVLLVIPPQFVAETGSSASLANWPLPATGLYTVRLLHASGDGMYSLSLRLKLAKATKSVTGFLGSGAQQDSYPLPALRGSLVSLQAKRQGAGNELEPNLGLLDPGRCALALGGYLRLGSGLVTVKGCPLPNSGAPYQTGSYTVVVSSRNGKLGTYRFTSSVTPPKVLAVKLERALLLGISPKAPKPGAPLTLKVAGADALLTNNVVRLDGQPVTIAKGTLRSGRGSLTITLPADTPVGTSSVSFRSDGEESNRITFPVAP